MKDKRRGHRSRQGTFDMGTEILNNLQQRNCIDDFGTDYLKD